MNAGGSGHVRDFCCWPGARGPSIPSRTQPTMYLSMANGGATLDPVAAASMISLYRQNNGLGAVVVDPDLMKLAEAAVAGDGQPQQARPRREGAAGQAPECRRLSGDAWRSKTSRPAITRWRKPFPAGGTRRRTRPICSRTVSQNWASRRSMLPTPNTRCSGRSFLHRPEARYAIQIAAGRELGVLLPISPIDAAANCRHGAAPRTRIEWSHGYVDQPPAPATTPAESAARAGAAGRRRARLLSGRRLSGAVSLRISSRNGWLAFRSVPSMRRSSPATSADKRDREAQGILGDGVVAGVVESDDAGRPRALAVQRDLRRADRDLRRARLLHAARSARAAVAARQPAVAELLRHRAAEDDAGAAGRLRPHQRSARRGSASARSA